MQSFKSGLIALAVAAAVTAGQAMTAGAADLNAPPPDFEPPLLPSPSQSHFYVGLRGAATFGTDTDIKTLGTTVTTSYDDPGWLVSGFAGYNFVSYPGLRGELELGYLSDSVLTQQVHGTGTFKNGNASGDASTLFGFASLYYDLPFQQGIHPFIGAGLGFGNVSLNNYSTSATGALIDDSGTGFAYHLTGGVAFDITPNMDLEIGYRYMATTGVDLQAKDGTSTSVDTADHVIFAGLRYKF